KAAYAISLEQAGFDEEAIKQYEELLELNPNDNQGVREQLLPLYIQYEDFKSINKLFNAYKDDITAAFLFSKALFTYFTEGLTTQSIRSEEHTSELQSRFDLVCRLLLEKKKQNNDI